MPTSTESSGATETDLTMPRSVIGRWISGSETVARAAWMASSAGAVITAPDYVQERPASVREPRAALHEREDALLQQKRVDRLDEVVVGAGVPRLGLDAGAHGAREE